MEKLAKGTMKKIYKFDAWMREITCVDLNYDVMPQHDVNELLVDDYTAEVLKIYLRSLKTSIAKAYWSNERFEDNCPEWVMEGLQQFRKQGFAVEHSEPELETFEEDDYWSSWE